jgi:hypothetical protein
VTSVFGMTNMPAEPASFRDFGITLVAICIPFLSLIGFLSTKYGYGIWAAKTKQLYRWLRPKPKPKSAENEEDGTPHSVNRTMSTEEGMRLRMGAQPGGSASSTRKERRESQREGQRDSVSHPHIRKMVEAMGEGRQSGLVRLGTVVNLDAEPDASNATAKPNKDAIIDVKG